MKQAIAIDKIVAVKTPPKSNPPSDKITGFKNMMYAIVRNVVTPAITSVLKSVLCFLYSKYELPSSFILYLLN
jgi:hypothetical protein